MVRLLEWFITPVVNKSSCSPILSLWGERDSSEGNKTVRGGTLSWGIVLQWLTPAQNTLALHGRLELCQESNGLIHHTASYSIAVYCVLWFGTAWHCSLQRRNLSNNHLWPYHTEQVCRASRSLVMLGKHEAIVARLLKVCDVVISWILQATVMYFICCVTPLLSGIELPLLVQEECTAKLKKKKKSFFYRLPCWSSKR